MGALTRDVALPDQFQGNNISLRYIELYFDSCRKPSVDERFTMPRDRCEAAQLDLLIRWEQHHVGEDLIS